MSIKRILTLAAIALLPIAAGAATFVVPAAGTGAGANGSQWQTELTLHSTSSTPFTARLTFHDRNGAAETSSVDLAPRTTIAISDIVKTRFGRDGATGAIEIVVDDAFARKLAVASRTFNASENGEFGQDIPAVNLADAAVAGETVVIAAPANVAATRFNAGIYAATAASVRWELLRADGTTAKTVEIDYTAGSQTQYNNAVDVLFGESAANSDSLLAVVTKGKVIGYGSGINNATGDPTYVPGVETTSDIRIQFLGVDSDLDDKVNIADADHDGVLDAPLPIYVASPWPNSFHIIVAGNNPQFELVEPSNEISISLDGYVIWKPGVTGATTGTLQVRVTVDGVSDVITIPVKFLQ
jgi:hypothetical protein